MTIANAAIKVGDLVRLSTRATRKGMSHENQVGLVVAMHAITDTNFVVVTVNFSGLVLEVPRKDLRVIDESR
jgi:hypothetical protein